MAKVNETDEEVRPRKRPRPAKTPEAREAQMIALAVDVAEERLLDRTATAQEIIHFLRLGTVRAQLELEKIKQENELLKAKTDDIRSEQTRSEMFEKAVAAMKRYNGHQDEEDDE
jgi:hypothetical protein